MKPRTKGLVYLMDKYVSKHLPGWVIALVVSMFFAFWFAGGLGAIIALAYLDLPSLWSFWPRLVFAILTAVFYLSVAMHNHKESK